MTVNSVYKALILAVVTHAAQAQLVELTPAGKTEIISVYIEPLVKDKTQGKRQAVQSRPPIPTPDLLARVRAREALDEMAQAHTPELTPGKQPSLRIDLPAVTRPVCVVGSDARSLSWLSQHRERLIELMAVCLLIESRGIEDLKRVQEVARGIPIIPGSAQGIFSAQGFIRHYPFLISNQGVEQ